MIFCKENKNSHDLMISLRETRIIYMLSKSPDVRQILENIQHGIHIYYLS